MACLLVGLCLVGEAQAKTGEALVEEAANYRREGRQYQAMGQVDKALQAYVKAVLALPEFADAHVDVGVMYEAKSQLALAEAEYQKALQMNPEHRGAHSNLALLYEAQGKIDQAASHWQQRVMLGPVGDPWVHQARERLLKYRLKVPEVAETARAKARGKTALATEPPKPARRRAGSDPTTNYVPKARPRAEPKRLARTEARPRASAQPMAAVKPPAPTAVSAPPPDRETQRLFKQAEQLTKQSEALAERVRSQQVKAAQATEQSIVLQKRVEALRRQAETSKPVAPRPAMVKAPVAPPPAAPPKAVMAPVAPITTPREAQALAEQLAQEKERMRDLMVRELHQRGLILFRQKQYAKAIEQFQRALAVNPDHRESQQYLRESQSALARGER